MFGAFARTAARASRSQQRRSFQSTTKKTGGHSGGPKFHGFSPPYVDPIHTKMGEVMMAVMWFWIFYRAKEDGMAVLVSF
tara:strand:+ start:81 stop:320 length:240 start_codon:yes stop_codon:yes gene_type:complete